MVRYTYVLILSLKKVNAMEKVFSVALVLNTFPQLKKQTKKILNKNKERQITKLHILI